MIAVVNSACVASAVENVVDNIPTVENSTTPSDIINNDVAESTAVSQATITPEEAITIMSNANADVKFVKAIQAANGSWTFHVTVFHPDTGWEDYADGWDVVTPDGVILKPDQNAPFTRLLVHPHVDEQPFTRSQSGIVIPTGVTVVIVRAHDMVDGFGGIEVTVDLTQSSGDNYEVQASN